MTDIGSITIIESDLVIIYPHEPHQDYPQDPRIHPSSQMERYCHLQACDHLCSVVACQSHARAQSDPTMGISDCGGTMPDLSVS